MVQALQGLEAMWLPTKFAQTENCILIVTGWLPWHYLRHGTTDVLQHDEPHKWKQVLIAATE